MIDLHFRATSKRALVKLGRALNFIDANNNPLPGVDIDIIAKGQMADVPGTHIHVNVRLSHGALLLDRIEGTDENGFDLSKIRRWLKNNGVEINVSSVRRGGVTHRWFSKDFGNGDVVDLIWPAPEMARRVWL